MRSTSSNYVSGSTPDGTTDNHKGYLTRNKRGFEMAISQDLHKAIVIVTSSKEEMPSIALNFGFKEIADAIYFVSEQVTEEVAKKDYIVEALDDGALIDDVKYQILDIESYLDLYEAEDDNNE